MCATEDYKADAYLDDFMLAEPEMVGLSIGV